ncbi:MAG: alanine--glyoxylate aminotransferase family protein [Armatimonadota bacterium]|nr:alanine--glyoxylate aminotransferase family protein [Armatimonadota bacterium]MDR7451495.1 alanine--glyoxylate aminotransferase family protein [Armatimonadota bacterium]MDR7467462.1 alanine--glyoxylate aminotransferase family protein [Armatimonadota bacterium]MDR7494336.1 alanine--glyoxylate aminotransferase family protein [Armatimonadota bacterium]MDR7499153.1 alanine--glyoxylate aminotransferase family protein [Armatimonadota bacterium]
MAILDRSPNKHASDRHELLLIPGPTMLPPEVREAMAAQMVNHRGEAFGRILREVLEGLGRIYETASPVLPFAASGTGGLEAAVANVLSPGDRVLALSCGAFGDRFAEIARTYGAEVITLEAPWGTGIEPDAVAAALRRHAPVAAVLVTHNETSTGVANDLAALAGVVRPTGTLLLVDAVSSLGALELRTDAWGLDVVVAGSQKALMGPPGAVFISVSSRAWEAARRSRTPRVYFSFERARDALGAGPTAFTPFTPAVPAIYALAVSIPMILEEGLPARVERHRRMARMVREGVARVGLEVLPPPRWASDTVTAVRVPETVDARTLLRRLREEHGVVLAGGQGRLEGRIIRIGHMGAVDARDLQRGLEALAGVLRAMGHPVSRAVSAP